MTSVVKRIATGSSVLAVLPANEDPVEFPGDYFLQNPGKIRVCINRKLDVATLRQYVYEGLKNGDVHVCHINSYLYQVLKDTRDEAQSDWISFGVSLAVKGGIVSVFDTLMIEDYRGEAPDGRKCDGRTIDDDKWLPMLILGLYRVSRATQEDYKKSLLQKLYAQCKLRSPQAEELVEDAAEFYEVWSNDSNFLKLVAAIDMFFHKFKNHADAGLRWGTIVSRFKDCAALATLSHVQKVTGLSIKEVFTWVLNKSVEDELCRMMKERQEVDKADSYMPYLIDFGISTKSPYSSVKNPCFHFWGQLTALLVHSHRAKNARVPEDIPYNELTTAAWLFAYAMGRSSGLEQRFTTDDSYYQEDEDINKGLGVKAPTTRDVQMWLAWWSDIGKVPTQDMETFARREVLGLTEIRSKTIGEYAKKTFSV
ncbi:nucleocapsid protein [Isfahan virus]|uniref:Nucleoprotein n=1 Tax=Isfahan virus TaxID=290008 RepID=NCAP_ISFV|nr:nucleocapsid protein [Isfahan virus]Q5K2K7.1 RecName: Full=Nucleoprotein; Short=NP; AltName: Full=Nucleocapsid protein; Short=Protein N [Isfahan virus]CAH17544.1 nucleocapsid protein [Isfahan virus]